MKRAPALFILFICCVWNMNPGMAQSLPVGMPVLEDYYRRSQLLGQIDSSISFTVRPLFPQALNVEDIFHPDSNLNDERRHISPEFKNNKSILRILPITWQQQYNTHHPYGWNDGSMIRAKGYQMMFSAGVYAKYGPLSVQLSPEFVFAENKTFAEYPTYYNNTDLPERYGEKAYYKLSWGQSSIRLSFGPVSLGLSDENLWWGPGIRNSLLMSNSASGFKHLTLNTVRPIRMAIGSIEGQIIAGRLEDSGFTPPKPDDWRYLSAMVFSYQPKWVPGLFLGLTRSFQAYHRSIRTFADYFPLFRAYQKVKDKVQNAYGSDAKDQLTSLFVRWLLTNAKAELYFEYGLNDNSYNLRDFVQSPEHSRTYIFGMRKLLPFRNRQDEHIQVSMEVTQLQQSIDRIVRDAGAWYIHGQIIHGYTNLGEVLGAGIGPGSNLQSFDISWIKELKRIGLQLERYVHNNDFYYAAINNGPNGQWIDLSVSANGDWNYKNLLFNAKLQAIQSLNYQWKSGINGLPKENVFNLHGDFGVTYRF